MKSMRLLIQFILAALFLAACTGSAEELTENPIPAAPTEIPTAVPGVFYVDPDITLGEISPYVYGTNYGPWVAVRFEMIEFAEQAGITIIRWPGGEWGDANNIRGYQVDQLMAFADQLGADVNIHVRLRNGTPEQAAELVRYANIEKEYGVVYWTIGNEPTLYDGYSNTSYDIDTFNKEWREFALAMRAVDPEIKLIGPEVHQYSDIQNGQVRESREREWVIDFLEANGDLVDVVSIHKYPFPKSQVGPNASIEDLRQNTQEWDPLMVDLKNVIREYTGREIPFAVTEVNSHYSKAVSGEGTPDSFYNAIWWADVLGRLIRQDAFIVNHWLLTSNAAQGGWGLLGGYEVRPSYYVNIMYDKLGSERIYASSDDSYVTITAAQHQDGTIGLMIINLTDEIVSKPIQIRGMEPMNITHWLFDETHSAENMGTEAYSGGFDLPPRSMNLLLISSGTE